MKTIIEQHRLWAICAALLALPVAFTGCSQDDPFEFDDNGKEAIDSPSPVQSATTVSQLTFVWDKVEGAVQYAYELRDPQNELVSGDVTTETTATFTKLKDNTLYTLNVWALTALNSEKKGSPVTSFKAKTDEIIQLSAPQLTAGKGNGGVLISWTAIEHADSYSYTVYDEGGKKKKEGSVTDSQVLIGGLAIGTYTIEVTAVSEQEAYSNSEIATLTFKRERIELWRRTGTYESASNGNFTADIVCYDDGSYAIEAPYGEAGYAINFSVDSESSEITIQNSEYVDGYVSFYVSSSYRLYSYTIQGYSKFSGDRSSGEVRFFTFCYDKNNAMQGSGSGGYDTFHWEKMSAETWSAAGSFVIANYPDEPRDATIYANGNNSYTIKDWYAEGFDINFTVDSEGKVTFVTDQSDDYYWYVAGSDEYYAYIYKPNQGYDAVFTGDMSGGSLKYYDAYDGWTTYTWGAGTATGPTIDDLVGSYAEKSSCQDYTIDYANWTPSEVESQITITKIDDTTIELSDLYNGWGALRGTVDLANRTITFAPQTWGGGYYLFCPYDDPTGSVVATFDEHFTITFSGWTAYYEAYSNSYINKATTVLTKQ